MGQQRQIALLAAEKVKFDFTAPDLFIARPDAQNLQVNPDPDGPPQPHLVERRAVKYVAKAAVQSAWPGGIHGPDRRAWAAWLEILDENDDLKVEIPWALVDWLRKLLIRDDLKMPPFTAQWTEALIEYLQGLEPKVQKLDPARPPQTAR